MMTTLGKNIPTLYLKENTVFEAMTLELLQMSQPYQTHPTAKRLAFWSHPQWSSVPWDGYFQTPTLHLYSLNSAEIHTGTHRNGFGTSFCMDQYFHQHWYFGTLPLRKDAFHFMSKQECGWVTWFLLVSKEDKVCIGALLKAAERQKGDRIWTRSNKYTLTSTCSMRLDKSF